MSVLHCSRTSLNVASSCASSAFAPSWNPLGNDVHTDVCVSRDLTATEGLIIPNRGHLDRRIPGVVHNSFVVLHVEIMLLRRRRSV